MWSVEQEKILFCNNSNPTTKKEKDDHVTVNSHCTISGMPNLMWSPGTTGPIPGGVPVRIRSLGSNVMYWLIKAISFGTVKINSFVFASCCVSPFTHENSFTLWGSGISSLDMNRETGQAVSKPFPMVHESPLLLASFFNKLDKMIDKLGKLLNRFTYHLAGCGHIQCDTISPDII